MLSAAIMASSIMLGTSIIEAVGLTVLRMKQSFSIPVAAAIYAVAVVPLLSIALKYEGIGLVNFFWNIFSTLVMFIIGIYYFKEKINNLQLIGVAISLLGVFLILVAPDAK